MKLLTAIATESEYFDPPSGLTAGLSYRAYWLLGFADRAIELWPTFSSIVWRLAPGGPGSRDRMPGHAEGYDTACVWLRADSIENLSGRNAAH
ncbi:hypothetical protein [Altererythrobacter fulvus]|uniref:hypothetical protein n=1 Tax=Caenibius fulvus TaxID=2126012 RepID=UPI003016650D